MVVRRANHYTKQVVFDISIGPINCLNLMDIVQHILEFKNRERTEFNSIGILFTDILIF